MTELFHGNIVYSASPDELALHENSFIAVEDGRVAGIYPQLPEEYLGAPLTDLGRALIIPAFSDLHIHAPQYAQRGTGMDLLLSDWLSQNTFPEEAKFSDTEYAQRVYTALADDMIRNGTFHASVFATIHTEASFILAQILESRGMHAFVGKVNMDKNSPDYLCETTASSLRDTEDFLARFESGASVQPILTPRFASTCSRELLQGLGKLGAKYSVGMQTHLVESCWEAAEALIQFPDCLSDAEIYEKAGLLDNGPSILAHFIFPTYRDIETAKKHNAVTVHCPDATVNIIAGIMQTGRLKDEGVRIALGTDIGAGSRTAVFSQVARTVQLSKLKDFYEQGNRPVSFKEAFYMATAGAGSVFGAFGSFRNGSVFDALVIDGLEPEGVPLSPADRLERFCYIGDDRNITRRYMNGKEI